MIIINHRYDRIEDKLTNNVGVETGSGNTTRRSSKRSSTRTSIDRLLSSAVEVVFPKKCIIRSDRQNSLTNVQTVASRVQR